MKEPRLRPDGLQLEEHRHFQERFWTLERAAWIVFCVITVSAILGFTGAGGPFATSTATTVGAEISSPRVARWETADNFLIRFAAKPAVTERIVRFSPAFAKSFQVEDIQPAPSRTFIEADGQSMVFSDPLSAGGQVSLHIRSQSVGINSYDVTVDGGAPIALTTYVLP